MTTRDYDSTIARIAGNIASGLCAAETYYGEQLKVSERSQDIVCQVAVRMARRIVELCRNN